MTSTLPPSATPPEEIGVQVLVRGWLSANNMVFRDGEAGASVVDTGYFSHADQTLALIEQALRGATLTQVVNTHLHSDHCGANASLARRWDGLRISVPLGYRDISQQCEPFTPQAFLSDGDTIRLGPRDWEVHAAPGHDPDAVLLFEPISRTLISGDALWESRLAIIFPELVGEPGFDAAAKALDLIEGLRPALVLPGHGQPFRDVASALTASRQRLQAFVAAPIKHRQHAARALVSYHMLEHRAKPRAALVSWIASTPVIAQALACEGDADLAQALANQTVDRLLADGVLRADGECVALAQAD